MTYCYDAEEPLINNKSIQIQLYGIECSNNMSKTKHDKAGLEDDLSQPHLLQTFT